MPPPPRTPNGASFASVTPSAPNRCELGLADERAAIIGVERALRLIDERYQPSDDEIAALAGVTTAAVRGLSGSSRAGAFGTVVAARDNDG